jgi:hypothetical protein
LEYALNRNSRQATNVLLDHVINSDKLSSEIEMDEICTLISSSSSTLALFFEKAISIVEGDVPKFGNLIKSPSYMV